ncbi:PspC domain-containing protein [Spirillospora sp. NPDC029432]|uniref:PspC domain-containing protein n=1 Tax=Spirillospora sp. NPDC029432 TaxID=3154599 RepID=UPI0034545094
MNGLYRPRQGRMIAGVCAGLGRRFGMSATTVRLLALLSCLLPGPQFVAYLVLWIMLPNEDGHAARSY